MQLTERQREAIEWAIDRADRMGRPADFPLGHETKAMADARVLRELLAAHNAGAQEPIYQVRRNGMDKWIDVTHEAYELRNYGQYERRIVYTQPQPMQQTDASNHRAPIEAIEYALHADEGLEFLRCWQHGEFDSCRDEWPDAPEVCYPSAPMTDAARDVLTIFTRRIANDPDVSVELRDEARATLRLAEIERGEREGE